MYVRKINVHLSVKAVVLTDKIYCLDEIEVVMISRVPIEPINYACVQSCAVNRNRYGAIKSVVFPKMKRVIGHRKGLQRFFIIHTVSFFSVSY